MTVPALARRLPRLPLLPTVPAVIALLAMFAVYYWSPWALVAWAALVGWGVVALLRPDLAVALCAATIPFLFQPRIIGDWQFAPAETTLLATFAAVLLRRLAGIAPASSEDAPAGSPHPTLAPLGRGDSGLSPTQTDTALAIPHPEAPPGIQNPKSANLQSAIRDLQSAIRNSLAADAFALPALALLAVATFSLLTVADAGYLKSSLREYRWTIVEPVLFYFLATEVLRGRRGALRLADGLIAGATVAAGGALLFAALGQGLVVEGVTRVMWPYVHPNNLALLLGRVAPFAAVVALFLTPPEERTRRRLYALACLPLFLALALTFSRGAYVGVIAAGFVVAGLVGRRRIVLALGGIVAAGAVIIAADTLLHFLPGRIASVGSAFLRVGLWRSALAMLRDHPIFGVGLDQFLNQYQYYVEPTNDYERFTNHPHNIVLDFWLRLGIIGLLVWIWTVVQFVRLAHALTRSMDGVRQALALGLLALLTDILVHGLIDNSYFLMDLALVFWAGCAILQILRGDEPAPATDRGSLTTNH
jgi:O-antigen ligase